jgi:hypothetical protein
MHLSFKQISKSLDARFINCMIGFSFSFYMRLKDRNGDKKINPALQKLLS